MFKRLLFCLVIILRISSIALAEPIDDAIAAYNLEDFETALRTFKPLSEQGDPEAQCHLGVMYRDGQGVKQDYSKAIRWFRLAAEQEHTGAQRRLGSMYFRGWGVDKNLTEAVKWTRKAAEQGDATAQLNLGLLY